MRGSDIDNDYNLYHDYLGVNIAPTLKNNSLGNIPIGCGKGMQVINSLGNIPIGCGNGMRPGIGLSSPGLSLSWHRSHRSAASTSVRLITWSASAITLSLGFRRLASSGSFFLAVLSERAWNTSMRALVVSSAPERMVCSVLRALASAAQRSAPTQAPPPPPPAAAGAALAAKLRSCSPVAQKAADDVDAEVRRNNGVAKALRRESILYDELMCNLSVFDSSLNYNFTQIAKKVRTTKATHR